MKRTRFNPRLHVKLKEPVTQVEVLEEEAGGSLLVFAGSLSGWINPDLLDLPPNWRDRKISKETASAKASRCHAK